MEKEAVAKPEWLKIRPRFDTDFSKIKTALRRRGLVTVCEEAHCPNMAECWHNEGTATFMVLGDTCTRGCRFCAINTARKGQAVDELEPEKIADAIAEMELTYAVITAVDRDDLADGGAAHFARCISTIKIKRAATLIEVLIGDFAGDTDALRMVVDAHPEVIAHNIETVERLQKNVRDLRANYRQSLAVLKHAKEMDGTIFTKSAIMVGLGETREEVVQSMRDLRAVGCDMLTIGQYLKPSNKRLAVEEYVDPDTFRFYEEQGKELGFLYVAAGPFVRSSYRAGELFVSNVIKEGRISPTQIRKKHHLLVINNSKVYK